MSINVKKIIFSLLNRNFALTFSLGEDRRHLENENKSKFILHSAQFALSLQTVKEKYMSKDILGRLILVI
jgi:hypothetical protein